MVKYRLAFTPRAKRDLKALDATISADIEESLKAYADGARTADVRRRIVPPGWRMRVGDYRAFFRREDGVLTVLRVSHRRETYEPRRGP